MIAAAATARPLAPIAAAAGAPAARRAAPRPLGRALAAAPGRSSVRARVFSSDEEGGPDKKKKVLRREDEPDEYWKSEREREGKSAWSDPLAIIGIVAIFFPFVVLSVAIATGYVELQH